MGEIMSRNKYPEETREKILEVAMKLFMTKGYDKTSLNDVIAGLGGLTKGAIYHHFKSKEDILVAVVEMIADSDNAQMREIIGRKDLNGKQKIEAMYEHSMANEKQESLFAVTPNLVDNPTFLAYYLKMLHDHIVPVYFIPVIQEGVADGSIQTDYPEELGELIIYLSDIWLNPLVIPMTPEKMAKKALLYNQLFEPFGLHILSKTSIERISRIIESLNEK